MKTRKTVLLSAIAFLAVVWVLQLVFSGPSGAKTLALKDAADTVTVRKAGSTGVADVTLRKADAGWTVGDKNYAADSAAIDALVESLTKLKVLGTVSGTTAPGGVDEERFGLAGGTALEITLSKGGKTLRTVLAGKASPTAQQSYARIDGKKEVLLVAGNLAEDFGKSEGDFRDKNVYSLSADTLIGVAVSGPEAYVLSKSGSPAVWVAAPSADGMAAPALDTAKAGSWVSSLASLRATEFLSDDLPLPDQPLGTVTLDFGAKKVSVTVLEKRGDSEYLMKSSESPSPFIASSYVAERYLKKLTDLAAK